jgi:phenylacetate-CoA ligase
MESRLSRDDPTDEERYPTLSAHGREMLRFLREHPFAPLFRNQSGNRLSAEDVEAARAFEREVLAAPWQGPEKPPWLADFVGQCFGEVPHFRRLGSAPARFEDVPSTSRADLARDIAAFVPDSAPLERLINFRTSGTTGHPLLIASHPLVAAGYLAFHKRALRRFGVELRHGRGQVGVALLGHQRQCFTYASVTPTMDDSGLVKLNLHANDWRKLEDRGRYLDAIKPEVLWGDPIAFAELLTLALSWRPRALLSTSMAMPAGLRAELEQRFACPLLDVYSMNESGPVAVHDPTLGAHALLQQRLYVEILGSGDQPLPLGEQGEITLTGGFNFCLPLLRYRTGDYAALRVARGELVLEGLQGRPPVRFRSTSGEWLNNIEVTRALTRFAMPQYALHQRADASLVLRFVGRGVHQPELAAAVRQLFGDGQALALEELPGFADKVVMYTSELPGAPAGST